MLLPSGFIHSRRSTPRHRSEIHSWRNQKKRHGLHGFHRFVKSLRLRVAPGQKYDPPGFLNLWNQCNPWRFCFFPLIAADSNRRLTGVMIACYAICPC